MLKFVRPTSKSQLIKGWKYYIKKRKENTALLPIAKARGIRTESFDESPVSLFIYAVKAAAKSREYKGEKRFGMRSVLKLLKARGFGEEDRKHFLRLLEFLMTNSQREYRELFIEDKIEIMEGKKVEFKTLEEQIWDEAEAKGRNEGHTEERTSIIRSLINSGLLTIEQIASATGQTIEYVTSLRHSTVS